jgi:hypothetical protein
VVALKKVVRELSGEAEAVVTEIVAGSLVSVVSLSRNSGMYEVDSVLRSVSVSRRLKQILSLLGKMASNK